MTWPLAFSTLGCSGLPLRDVVALTRKSGWPGLELRAAPDEPVHIGLSARERAGARALLAHGGAIPVMIASYVKVASAWISDRDCVAQVVRHAELAADLGAPYVRVFPGAQEPGEQADLRAARRLSAIAEEIGPGVSVLLETHDSHPRGVDVARVLRMVKAPPRRVGAVWDVLHPWRDGEAPTRTAVALGPYLRHVQIKDVVSRDLLAPVPLGHGALPLARFYEQLRVLRYHGWLSLEWESKWHPGARPLAEALAIRPELSGR